MDVTRYMTVGQACKALGVSRARVYNLIREGRLEIVRLGEHILILRGEDGLPARKKPERAG
jgi:excisionase family DNA binding protein